MSEMSGGGSSPWSEMPEGFEPAEGEGGWQTAVENTGSSQDYEEDDSEFVTSAHDGDEIDFLDDDPSVTVDGEPVPMPDDRRVYPDAHQTGMRGDDPIDVEIISEPFLNMAGDGSAGESTRYGSSKPEAASGAYDTPVDAHDTAYPIVDAETVDDDMLAAPQRMREPIRPSVQDLASQERVVVEGRIIEHDPTVPAYENAAVLYERVNVVAGNRRVGNTLAADVLTAHAVRLNEKPGDHVMVVGHVYRTKSELVEPVAGVYDVINVSVTPDSAMYMVGGDDLAEVLTVVVAPDDPNERAIVKGIIANVITGFERLRAQRPQGPQGVTVGEIRDAFRTYTGTDFSAQALPHLPPRLREEAASFVGKTLRQNPSVTKIRNALDSAFPDPESDTVDTNYYPNAVPVDAMASIGSGPLRAHSEDGRTANVLLVNVMAVGPEDPTIWGTKLAAASQKVSAFLPAIVARTAWGTPSVVGVLGADKGSMPDLLDGLEMCTEQVIPTVVSVGTVDDEMLPLIDEGAFLIAQVKPTSAQPLSNVLGTTIRTDPSGYNVGANGGLGASLDLGTNANFQPGSDYAQGTGSSNGHHISPSYQLSGGWNYENKEGARVLAADFRFITPEKVAFITPWADHEREGFSVMYDRVTHEPIPGEIFPPKPKELVSPDLFLGRIKELEARVNAADRKILNVAGETPMELTGLKAGKGGHPAIPPDIDQPQQLVNPRHDAEQRFVIAMRRRGIDPDRLTRRQRGQLRTEWQEERKMQAELQRQQVWRSEARAAYEQRDPRMAGLTFEQWTSDRSAWGYQNWVTINFSQQRRR